MPEPLLVWAQLATMTNHSVCDVQRVQPYTTLNRDPPASNSMSGIDEGEGGRGGSELVALRLRVLVNAGSSLSTQWTRYINQERVTSATVGSWSLALALMCLAQLLTWTCSTRRLRSATALERNIWSWNRLSSETSLELSQ